MSSEKQLKYWLSLKGKPRTKRGSIQPCFICKEDFYVYPYQKEVSKFCSRKCQLVDRKGKHIEDFASELTSPAMVSIKVGTTAVSETNLFPVTTDGFAIPVFDQQIIDESLAPATTVIQYKKAGVLVATKTISVVGTLTTITIT